MSPDQLTLIGTLAGLGVLAVAHKTGSLARERRGRGVKALRVNDPVEIDAGPHRGLAGWVHDVFVNTDDGQLVVTVRLQDGSLIPVKRDDVSPV